MIRSDIHIGLEVAVSDPWKSIEKGEVTEIEKDGRLWKYTVELYSGRSRGTSIKVGARALVATWHDYEPFYEIERRRRLKAEAERMLSEQDQAEKMEKLQIIRERLKAHDIMTALGNVHVPGHGYEAAIIVRYDGCITLDKILSEVAQQALLGDK